MEDELKGARPETRESIRLLLKLFWSRRMKFLTRRTVRRPGERGGHQIKMAGGETGLYD